jgi:predicted nucleic acid-binding protein
MDLLVTDASPWVAFFREEFCPLFEAAMKAGILALPALVKVELLGNPLGGRERKALEAALESVPVLGLDEAHLLRAARLKATLDTQGVLISARDAHVIQCAKDAGGALLSRDPLFARIQKSAGVRVEIW